MPAIDGTTGGWAVDPAPTASPFTYIQTLGIRARLNTLLGRQLMRPNYGISLTELVDRPLSSEEVANITRVIRASLSGFAVQVIVTTPSLGHLRVDVRPA